MTTSFPLKLLGIYFFQLCCHPVDRICSRRNMLLLRRFFSPIPSRNGSLGNYWTKPSRGLSSLLPNQMVTHKSDRVLTPIWSLSPISSCWEVEGPPGQRVWNVRNLWLKEWKGRTFFGVWHFFRKVADIFLLPDQNDRNLWNVRRWMEQKNGHCVKIRVCYGR